MISHLAPFVPSAALVMGNQRGLPRQQGTSTEYTVDAGPERTDEVHIRMYYIPQQNERHGGGGMMLVGYMV